MINQEKEKFLPIGSPEKAESKETLPAVEVANEVIWVNSNFPELPFDLKEGGETKLGLFLTPIPLLKNFQLEVDWRHGRSALLGRVIFKDKQGNYYRDVDLKGMGHVISWDMSKIEVGETYQKDPGGEAIGIFKKRDAIEVKEISEKFAKAGIRTERFLAIIELKEIIDERGNKFSAEAARKSRFYESTIPVIAVRAFGTKNRMAEIQGREDLSKIEDAKKMASQELGIDDKNFSFSDYLEWFAETLGKNIGLMHKNHWAHTCLTLHNITLDCRIVDLDEVKDFKLGGPEKKRYFMVNDWQIAKNNFKFFYDRLRYFYVDLDKKNLSNFEERFNQAYIEALGYKPDFIKE